MTQKIRRIVKNLFSRTTPKQKTKLHLRVADEECISNLFDVLVCETPHAIHPEIASMIIDFLREYKLDSGSLSSSEYDVLSV